MTIEELNEIAMKGLQDERERTRRSEEAIANGKARPYEEVLDDLNYHTCQGDRKKLQRLHKELKFYGDGISVFDRYGFDEVEICTLLVTLVTGLLLVVLLMMIAYI